MAAFAAETGIMKSRSVKTEMFDQRSIWCRNAGRSAVGKGKTVGAEGAHFSIYRQTLKRRKGQSWRRQESRVREISVRRLTELPAFVSNSEHFLTYTVDEL